MYLIDSDLLSVQEARIIVENAWEAQKNMAEFSQEKLDLIIEKIACAVAVEAEIFAKLSYEDTGYGNVADKQIKNLFVSRYLPQKLKSIQCVGVISQDCQSKTMDIGVPVGVIVALPPDTNPVSTTIYKTLISIKSGNAIVFSLPPKAKNSVAKVLDLMIEIAESHGLPQGGISYLRHTSIMGTQELFNHKHTAMLLITGREDMKAYAVATGKPFIYGGDGNGPAFIERSADIKKAVSDIVSSRTFDNGVVSTSEQSVVVDGCIVEKVREELVRHGGYFMSSPQSEQLGRILSHEDVIGKDAVTVAKLAGFSVPDTTKILISEQKYVSENNPYSKRKLCPVLAFFIEENWQDACEKCIELLLGQGKGHTLVMHANDEEVIRAFAMKKPVSRVLVNTASTFGGIGMTTDLFPAMTLGTGAAGGTVTSDNISPYNLINIRKVGYETRSFDQMVQCLKEEKITSSDDLGEILEKLLRSISKV